LPVTTRGRAPPHREGQRGAPPPLSRQGRNEASEDDLSLSLSPPPRDPRAAARRPAGGPPPPPLPPRVEERSRSPRASATRGRMAVCTRSDDFDDLDDPPAPPRKPPPAAPLRPAPKRSAEDEAFLSGALGGSSLTASSEPRHRRVAGGGRELQAAVESAAAAATKSGHLDSDMRERVDALASRLRRRRSLAATTGPPPTLALGRPARGESPSYSEGSSRSPSDPAVRRRRPAAGRAAGSRRSPLSQSRQRDHDGRSQRGHVNGSQGQGRRQAGSGTPVFW